MLKRELNRLANLRMEIGARTQEEFEGVVQMWDKLDANRQRRERYHEISCPHDIMDLAPDHYFDDMLDTILDSADWFHHMTEDADVSTGIRRLTKKQREVLYLYKVRVLKVWQIAGLVGKTDRNVRKMRGLLFEHLREKLRQRIVQRLEHGPPVTNAMRWFLEKTEKEGENSHAP